MKIDKNYLIYKHTNKINGKIYVGQTCLKPEQRWENKGKGYESYNVTKDGKKYPSHFWGAIQKYGWENFEHKILIHGLTKEQADIWEKKLIKKWDLINKEKGYNKKEGGSKGKLLEETKNKISETVKEQYKNGTRNINGENNGMYKKNHSNKTKYKISKTRKERIISGDIVPWNKGKTDIFSEETKQKISNALKETYKKFGHPSFKKVIRLYDNKIYNCMKDCAKDNGIKRGTITRHCQNKVKKPEFMYYNDWIKYNY